MASTTRTPSRRFLPPDPRTEEPYRLTPQLALRIAILGTVALAAFAILFLRLWALQVISGSQYLRAAQNNQLRTIPVQARRGPILDRNGNVLVANRPGTAIQIWASDLPNTWAERRDELRALAALLHVPVRQIFADLKERADDPLTPVTVKESARESEVLFLSERREEFPGVKITPTYLRDYPHGALAAQLLGFVAEVSPAQLEGDRKRIYRPGDRVGQAGVESAFDLYLRGKRGLARARFDSVGRRKSDFAVTHQPQAGYALRLTIDLKLQQAAENALRYGIQTAREQGEWAANGGAVVALDPRDGAVLALASSPTYNPSVYVGRVKEKALRPLVDRKAAERANFPALNRAIAGVYPPGSTFKPVTAIAAMQEHLISPYAPISCTGSYKAYGQTFNNWDPNVYEGMTLPTALARSCDTYFYQVGRRFFELPKDRGQPLQRWARSFGFGQKTGIEIGPESSGLLPTIPWKKRTYTPEADPCCWQQDVIWKPGDSIQLAIGQKDLLVTPLQMARLYALIANGGKLVTPHVVIDVEQPGDDRSPAVIRRRFSPAPPKRINVDPAALSVIRDGLYEATHSGLGTSSGIFGSFPVEIAGKTGTAEKVVTLPGFTGLRDQSWWCGYGPVAGPKIVVCVVIENGGHGGSAAAPAALKVFEAYFGTKATSQSEVYSD